MKNKPILFFLFSLLLGSFFALQGATLPHQGRVLISGKAFEGTGSFRFALVDTAGNLVWNHQGTTGEPTTDLALEVKGGFYSIALGDPSVAGMADLPASLFTNYAGLKLRIWFNDGTNGLQQLGTDQALLVAPYALSADSGSAQRIADLEASLAQALARIATLEQPPSTGGSGSGSTGGSSPIQNYSASRSYARGALVILGQDSYIATANVPFDVAPPNASYWTNLSVAANALNVPVETIPTLSTDTILNALPGTSPSGPNQPGPSLPGEVAATSRSYVFVDGTAQYQEVTLPSAAQNVGKEYVIHSKISDLLIKGNKGEIQSEDYALLNIPSNWVSEGTTLSFVSDGSQWISTRPHSISSTSFGSGVFVDIAKGAGASSPANFAVMGNHLYFSAADAINGNELWKTDGTVYGTVMVKDLNPGSETGSNPTGLTVFNNVLYFAATDASGTELWKSDGTANGTVLFKDLVPGSGSGNPTNIRVDGNQLRFNAAQESWNSDGTLAGTVVQGPSFTDNPYAKLGNWYYFAGTDANGTELWRSDSTSHQGQLFKDIYPDANGSSSSNPTGMIVFNDTLYFAATDSNGTELWKSDGTPSGTLMVKDLYPGTWGGWSHSSPNSSSPHNFSIVDNVLYFTARQGEPSGQAYDWGWKTDGTANGTVKVSGMRGTPVKFGNALYYQGQDALGAELHRVELNGSSVSDLWASANDLGNDWKSLSWFGTYYVNPQSGWITHGKLGSVYLGSPGNWLYHGSLGWMWTSSTVYPYLYRHSNSDWLYLGNQDAYYSYSSNSWVGLTGGFSGGPTPYDTSTAYAVGEIVIFGQESYRASTSVAAGVSPPGGGWSAPLVYWSDSFGAPTEAIPTLSTSNILNSLPGSAPNTGGPSAPTGATHVVDLNSTVQLQMIRVEPGTFTMGSPTSEAGRGTDETQHQVTLTKPFYLGKYEVTQAQYEAVMSGNTNGLNPEIKLIYPASATSSASTVWANTWYTGPANLAIDSNSTVSTSWTLNDMGWLEVDLGKEYEIHGVSITWGGHVSNGNSANIYVDGVKIISEQRFPNANLTFTNPIRGRIIRYESVAVPHNDYLQIATWSEVGEFKAYVVTPSLATPSQFSGNPNHPVENVSWDDVQVFLARLNAAEQAAGRLPAGWSYILPTEAQWEYACRAGTTTAYFWGDTITPNNANYEVSGGQSRDVGQYAANPWGFYDMHGNIGEWVNDWIGSYPTSHVTDPTGPLSAYDRVFRGSTFIHDGSNLRSAGRYNLPPSSRGHNIGFRLAFKQQ